MSCDVDGPAAAGCLADAKELREGSRALDGGLLGACVRVDIVFRAVDGERSLGRTDPGTRPVLAAPVIDDIVLNERIFCPAIDADVGIAYVGCAGDVDLEIRVQVTELRVGFVAVKRKTGTAQIVGSTAEFAGERTVTVECCGVVSAVEPDFVTDVTYGSGRVGRFRDARP